MHNEGKGIITCCHIMFSLQQHSTMTTKVQLKHSGRKHYPEPTEKEVYEANLWQSSWANFKKSPAYM
jgi:hypothetical protein